MFLFDPTFGASFEHCETEVKRLLDRAGAELVFCKRWDERRLAFKVKGRKRGVYVLCYFRANAKSIGGIERDVQISETVLRVLILRADGVTPEMMEKSVTLHGALDGVDASMEEESGTYQRRPGGDFDRPRRFAGSRSSGGEGGGRGFGSYGDEP